MSAPLHIKIAMIYIIGGVKIRPFNNYSLSAHSMGRAGVVLKGVGRDKLSP